MLCPTEGGPGGRFHSLFARGWAPHPAQHLQIYRPWNQETHGTGTRFYRRNRFTNKFDFLLNKADWQFSGRVFYDGSCFQRFHDSQMSRAGWAVCEVEGKT